MTTPAEVLAEYSRAFERDPEQAAMGFYSEDIVLRVPGAHPYAGTHRGRDRAIEALSAWAAATNGTLGPTEATMVALATDTAVVHVAMTATRHGRSAQWERMILYRFRNRRICEIVFFEYDLHTVEGLFEHAPESDVQAHTVETR